MGRVARPAVFAAAAHSADEFPSLGLPEVALAGRSNVGKSSFLNALVGGEAVARTSRTPGRTRSVNFYRFSAFIIVDLPGYGYAQVSKEERRHWKTVVESYFRRSEVRLAVLVVDARTGATVLDQTMSEWLRSRRIPSLVVVTKVDKLGAAAARTVAAAAAATLAIEIASVVPVSARTGAGVREAWRAIDAMLV